MHKSPRRVVRQHTIMSRLSRFAIIVFLSTAAPPILAAPVWLRCSGTLRRNNGPELPATPIILVWDAAHRYVLYYDFKTKVLDEFYSTQGKAPPHFRVSDDEISFHYTAPGLEVLWALDRRTLKLRETDTYPSTSADGTTSETFDEQCVITKPMETLKPKI